MDHMQSRMCKNADHFRRYVRNPRVSNEILTPYKDFQESRLKGRC